MLPGNRQGRRIDLLCVGTDRASETGCSRRNGLLQVGAAREARGGTSSWPVGGRLEDRKGPVRASGRVRAAEETKHAGSTPRQAPCLSLRRCGSTPSQVGLLMLSKAHSVPALAFATPAAAECGSSPVTVAQPRSRTTTRPAHPPWAVKYAVAMHHPRPLPQHPSTFDPPAPLFPSPLVPPHSDRHPYVMSDTSPCLISTSPTLLVSCGMPYIAFGRPVITSRPLATSRPLVPSRPLVLSRPGRAPGRQPAFLPLAGLPASSPLHQRGFFSLSSLSMAVAERRRGNQSTNEPVATARAAVHPTSLRPEPNHISAAAAAVARPNGSATRPSRTGPRPSPPGAVPDNTATSRPLQRRPLPSALPEWRAAGGPTTARRRKRAAVADDKIPRPAVVRTAEEAQRAWHEVVEQARSGRSRLGLSCGHGSSAGS